MFHKVPNNIFFFLMRVLPSSCIVDTSKIPDCQTYSWIHCEYCRTLWRNLVFKWDNIIKIWWQINFPSVKNKGKSMKQKYNNFYLPFSFHVSSSCMDSVSFHFTFQPFGISPVINAVIDILPHDACGPRLNEPGALQKFTIIICLYSIVI